MSKALILSLSVFALIFAFIIIYYVARNNSASNNTPYVPPPSANTPGSSPLTDPSPYGSLPAQPTGIVPTSNVPTNGTPVIEGPCNSAPLASKLPCGKMTSPGGNYTATLSSTGVLSMVASNGTTLWKTASPPGGTVPPYQLFLQGDGNLCIRDANNGLVWGAQPKIPGPGPWRAGVTNAGQLVIIDANNTVTWSK